MAKKVGVRLKAAGTILTVSRYSEGLWIDYENPKAGRKKGPSEGPRDNRQTRQTVLDLATTNFSAGDKFVTLTFNDNHCDVTNVDECNRLFNLFAKRLRRRWPDLKYLSVIEFQDSNGRGAVHYHMLCNAPYMPKEALEALWGYGYIKVNRIRHVDNLGAYIVKYMVKDAGDSRLKGRNAYLCSQGLERPTILYGDDAERIAKEYGLDTKVKAAYEGEYQRPEDAGGGLVIYKQYNLLRPQGGVLQADKCAN